MFDFVGALRELLGQGGKSAPVKRPVPISLNRSPEDASFLPGPQTFTPMNADIAHLQGGPSSGYSGDIQGSFNPNIQGRGFAQGNQYNNPQILQANQGLQGGFGTDDTSYSLGPDGKAGFSLQDLLRRRY